MDDKREELISLLHSGVLTKLKIRTSMETIENMDDIGISKLWNNYESRYSGCIADAAINNLIELYLMILTHFYPDRDKEGIRKDLQADVILNLEAKKHLGRFISPSVLTLANIVSSSVSRQTVSPCIPNDHPKTRDSSEQCEPPIHPSDDIQQT